MRAVKKWIKMVKNMVWITGSILLLMLGIAGCAPGEGDAPRIEDTTQWENIWEKQSSTAVASQTYTDAEGNTIVYYCCKTTYYQELSAEVSVESFGVDRRALETVIDLDRASNHRDCKVGDWPAILCERKGRTYLCWTISPEYSCVIEYSAEAVAEEDIFRMAESVTMK